MMTLNELIKAAAGPAKNTIPIEMVGSHYPMLPSVNRNMDRKTVENLLGLYDERLREEQDPIYRRDIENKRAEALRFQRALVDPPKTWAGNPNPNRPAETEKNKWGWYNSLYTIPGDNDPEGQRDWTYTMRQNILDIDPKFQFTDDNKWMWDAHAATERIRQQETNWANGSGYRVGWGSLGFLGPMVDQISPIHFEPGGVRFGFGTNLYDDRNRQVVANSKTDMHPVGLNLQRATSRGLDRQTRKDILQISHDSVDVAQHSPYFAPEYYDWVSGTANPRDVQGFRETLTQDMRNEGFTTEQIAQAQRDVGHLVTGNLADTWLGNKTNQVQDIAREWGLRGSLLNLITAGAANGVAATGVGKAVSGAASSVAGKAAQIPMISKVVANPVVNNAATRTGGQLLWQTTRAAAPTAAGTFGVRSFADAAEHAQPGSLMKDISLITGLNKSRMRENQLKLIWGPEGYVQRQQGDSLYLRDASGNIQFGSDGYPIINNSENPADYYKYVQWANSNGWGDDLQSPEAQKAYIDWFTSNGATDTSIIGTPMFKSLSSADQADAMMNMVRSRLLWRNKGGTTLKYMFTKPSSMQVLAESLVNGADDDGSVSGMLTDFGALASPEVVDAFAKKGAGSTAGGLPSGEDTEAFYDLAGDIVTKRAKINPKDAGQMVMTLLDLNKARMEGVKKDIKAGVSEGVNRIKKVVLKDVLGNEEIVDSMGFKPLYELALTLQQLDGVPGGMESLGDEGPALVARVRSNIQRGLLKSAMDDPMHNIPLLVSLAARTQGWDGVADFVKEPAAFWTTAALLLAGGVLTVSSVFDSDDEDEEETEDAETRKKKKEDAEYKRALNRQPFT